MLRYIPKPNSDCSLMPDIATQSQNDSGEPRILYSRDIHELLYRSVIDSHQEDVPAEVLAELRPFLK